MSTTAPEIRLDSVQRARAIAAEFIGSAGLAVVVIGSGIQAARLSPGDTGLALLENAFATGLGLAVLILVFASVSGAHFNPVVTLVDAAIGGRPWRDAAVTLPAQFAGCAAGAITANAMFGLPLVSVSATDRATAPTFLSEVIATAGLIVLIVALVRTGRAGLVPFSVGAYIAGAYFFTSSTSFANPAITVARTLSDTFAGIAPASVGWFVLAQCIGGALGALVATFLFPRPAR